MQRPLLKDLWSMLYMTLVGSLVLAKCTCPTMVHLRKVHPALIIAPNHVIAKAVNRFCFATVDVTFRSGPTGGGLT